MGTTGETAAKRLRSTPFWKEARDHFRDKLRDGQIKFPPELFDRIREKVLAITYDTPWEKIDGEVRMIIGSTYLEKLHPVNEPGMSFIAVSTPAGQNFEKYRVFQSLKNIFIANGKYMGRRYQGTKEIGGNRKHAPPGEES